MGKTRESVVQKELMTKLQATYKNGYIRKIAQSMYSHGGVPDILACINGEFVAIEVKTDSGKVSKLQARDIKLIEDAGGLALVCYGYKDIDYTIQLIGNHCGVSVSR